MEANSYNKMTQESLDEKTLTPNELTKREEIVKSLKKKQSDFVKRYGADRAKSVMYAVATKTAKEVTESLDEATDVKTDHMVGDSVWAKHPTEKSKTISGKVTRVGRTTYELEHKDGTKAMYPHKEVSANFEKLNPNPYKTKKQIQREHLEQTGEFLSLDEIALDERIEMPQGHKYSADPISKASENGQGRKKPQMGSKTNTAAVVAAILKKTKE